MSALELIAQGAEARIYKGNYLGKVALLKERFQKNYRHPDLDLKLTKDRIKAESRAIIRAKAAGVVTPALYLVNLEKRQIYMEYMQNTVVLKDFIDKNISGKPNVDHLLLFVARGMGELIARLHSKNIIHGDLTTSNILLRNVTNQSKADDKTINHFIVIDFGLSHVDSTVEDKAVDLYVLERSLLSAHSEISSLFDDILRIYQKYYGMEKQLKEIITKYREVQARGRKRLMIG